MNLIKFGDLKPGDRAKIVGFGTCDKLYRQRLLAMGLTIGSEFSVLRKAPLGDPFHIEIRGSSLSLRKKEADGLEIEKVSE
jgi:ferrous iron transport protein A